MNKKIIRLTESDLHKMIKESVQQILSESTFQTIGPILQNNESEEEAIDFLHGYDFSEDEPEMQTIGHAQFVDSANGIDLYYDYAGNYYFFAIEDKARSSFQQRLQQGENWGM